MLITLPTTNLSWHNIFKRPGFQSQTPIHRVNQKTLPTFCFVNFSASNVYQCSLHISITTTIYLSPPSIYPSPLPMYLSLLFFDLSPLSTYLSPLSIYIYTLSIYLSLLSITTAYLSITTVNLSFTTVTLLTRNTCMGCIDRQTTLT